MPPQVHHVRDLQSQRAQARLTSDEFAQDGFSAGALAGVVLVGDSAGLAAEFKAKKLVFESVESVLNFRFNMGSRGWRGRCCHRFSNRNR